MILNSKLVIPTVYRLNFPISLSYVSNPNENDLTLGSAKVPDDEENFSFALFINYKRSFGQRCFNPKRDF